MKKSLFKKLCRMAKDGDPEAAAALAEIVEELTEATGPDAPGDEVTLNVFTEPAAEAPAPAAADPAGDPAVEIVTPEGAQVAVDDADLAAVLERLDRIIALLSPAPAADEDPVEEIAEAVEEALEAAAEEPAESLLTEAAEPGIAEEIAEIVEEIVETAPASTVLSPEEDETCRDPRETGDALRAALRLKKAALAKLPKRDRLRLSRDVAARVSGKTRGSAVSVYGALSAARDTKAPRDDDADLGRRIMAKRNPNYKEV